MSKVYIIFEGRRYSPEFAEAVREWRRLCQLEGIPFAITQGGFNSTVEASAGSHGGDSIDVRTRGLTESQISRMIYLGRMVGIAVWFRTTNVALYGTRAQGFKSYHVHGVPNGWGHPSKQAADQARSYRNGRDGLIRNLADLGPGHTGEFRTRTWAEYKRLTQKTTPVPSKGEPEMSEAMVRKVIREELVDAQITANGQTKSLRQHELDDMVMGHARSVALMEMRKQISAMAASLGVQIKESGASVVAAIERELDESIHDAMSEHFPSMEKAEIDDIANSFLELLVSRLTKD